MICHRQHCTIGSLNVTSDKLMRKSPRRLLHKAWLVCVLLCGPAWVSAQGFGDRLLNDFPESGRWFANDGSRTGFFIEIQDGILAGLYVGAGGDGNNVWLNFSGRLQARFPDPDRPSMQHGWRLESELIQITGGGCVLFCSEESSGFNPRILNVGRIRIDFPGRNRGAFVVEELREVSGESTLVVTKTGEITPIIFGVESLIGDPGSPLVALPDLAGEWLAVRTPTPLDEVGTATAEVSATVSRAGILRLGPRLPEPEMASDDESPADPLAVRHVIELDSEGFFPEGSELKCEFFLVAPFGTSEVGTVQPHCRIDSPSGSLQSFEAPSNSITDARFNLVDQVGAEDAVVIQLTRLNHD